MTLLLALKDALIEGRHHKVLRTIQTECLTLRRLLEIVHADGYQPGFCVDRLDAEFLVALSATEKVPKSYLGYLRRLFINFQENNNLFEPELRESDFPDGSSPLGDYGRAVHSVLAKALTRTTLVHILDVCETAYEENKIDLARYAFLKLALNIYCRPQTYRRVRLEDLRIDRDANGVMNYFIDLLPAKSRVHDPKKISIRLHPEVGRLLEMHRKDVVATFGHLAPFDPETGRRLHGRLALFPMRMLVADKSRWVSSYGNDNCGMASGGTFNSIYVKPLKALCNVSLGCTVLRHTIGTQLAIAGCSSLTIQAVLKHASDKTCSAYVDIVFHNLIDELSDSLEPAFERHFPVATLISKEAPMPLERRIESEDIDAGGDPEITGVCGRLVACHYAPITCYACPRFIPCYDADHGINLEIVERELKIALAGGLSMQTEVAKCRTIKNHILVIMTACDNKRQAMNLAATDI